MLLSPAPASQRRGSQLEAALLAVHGPATAAASRARCRPTAGIELTRRRSGIRVSGSVGFQAATARACRTDQRDTEAKLMQRCVKPPTGLAALRQAYDDCMRQHGDDALCLRPVRAFAECCAGAAVTT